MTPPVALDARLWDHAGIGRYVRELARGLAASGRDALLLADERCALRAALPSLGFRAARSRIYTLAEQFEVPRLARGAALLHVPHFNVPLAWRGRLVATVHDLIYLRDPSASRSRFGPAYVRLLLGAVRRRAAAVLTVSEATKRDLVELVRLDPAKVHVTPEAASPVFRPISVRPELEDVRHKYGLAAPYVLHVGTLKPHKNVPRLVAAVDRVRARGLPHELVLVGRKDPRRPDLAALVESRPFVRHLGAVPDEDLAALYNAADAFVLPSLVEGFGLPLVEAMACGTPCLASDRSSLPEVLGDAGKTFDPDRVDALEEVLYNVLSDRELRQTMSEAALRRARCFSWRNTVEATLKVYDSVLR